MLGFSIELRCVCVCVCVCVTEKEREREVRECNVMLTISVTCRLLWRTLIVL
jgi:hypothetical protein